jgi:2-polyprenyl-3-methyl-5-hydroxy-6-metoxy-1,4-benzoquinol methylase
MQISRYDSHADWFLEYSQDWASTLALHLSHDVFGAKVLDLACGWGPFSRELAARGASVVAVDLAAPLLERARAIEADAPRGIRYVQGDACDLSWWDRQPFDGVVCNMALMDVEDLDAAMLTVSSVLRPSGWFSFSLLHPCYPGQAHISDGALSSWPPDQGYSAEGWWTTQSTGMRGHVGAYHRMLSTYLNAVIRAGLVFTAFTEPDPGLPRILIVDCRRP